MHSKIIESIIKSDFEGSFQPTFKDGRFSVINKQTVMVNMLNRNYDVNSELATNFNVCGRKPEVTFNVGEADFTGLNRKYFDDTNTYSPLSAINEFTKYVPGVRLTKMEVDAFAKSQVYDDTQESYLFNMLISWFKAMLYEDTSSTDSILKVKQSGYSDSHVLGAFGGVSGEVTHEIPMGPPVYEMPEVMMIQRGKDNYWDRPQVLRFDNKSSAQYTFYLIHCFGRDGNSSLNVDVHIPSIDFDQILFEPASGAMRSITNPESLPWTKASTLFGWIKDYVVLNRLEKAFSAAFEMLTAIAYAPAPSYQESLAWNNCVLQLSMSKFSPCRAKIPSNLEGEPMVHDMDAHDFVVSETQSPRKAIFYGALMSYLSFMGLHAVLSNYADRHSDWSVAYLHTHDELEVLHDRAARAALASVIIGKEITTFMNPNMYLQYDVTPMHMVKAVAFDAVIEPGYPLSAIINGVVPYVSGSLFLGACGADVAALSHLEANISVTPDAYGTVSP